MTIKEKQMYTYEFGLSRSWRASDEALASLKTFVQGMANRMSVSFHKYGAVADGFPGRVDAVASAFRYLDKYGDTGNTEFLMDVANFAMIETMRPSAKAAGALPEWALNPAADIKVRLTAPESEFSPAFVAMLVHDLSVKGDLTAAGEPNAATLIRVTRNLYRYTETGAPVALVIAASCAAAEFIAPSRSDAFFQATDSDGSPGRVTASGEIGVATHNNSIVAVAP